MLNLLLGKRESKDFIYYGSTFFKNTREPGWITNDFVKEMILDIDKCEVIGDNLVISPIFGAMSPDEMSNGVLTMICAFNNPTEIYNGNSCGNNCVDWLLKIGELVDITLILNYRMDFKGKSFKIRILNDNSIVKNYEELRDKYNNFLRKPSIAYNEKEVFGYER